MASKVSVGKTAPVPLGQQPAANSLPVVFAEDQQPIPVEEQNKIQSEVALSLLGIPRSEVALGIFADVNTYDINPTEWAQFPIENVANAAGDVTYGVEHVPDEAGAKLVATDGNTTLLTSKRFFRYQPGRVSASTMGVKMNVTADPYTAGSSLTTAVKNSMKGAPSLKKWGIFDKFDGYYFEIANSGKGNDFRCVRRTQAIIPDEPSGYSGDLSWIKNGGDTEYNTSTSFGEAGVDPVIIRDGLVYVAAAIYDPSLCYAPDDVQAIDGVPDGSTYTGNYSGAGERLKNYSFNSGYAVRLASYDGSTWTEKMNDRKFMFPFDQSTTVALEPENTSLTRGYIRADAHCNFYQVISNINRKAGYTSFLGSYSDFKGTDHYDNWGVTENVDPTQYSDLDTWDDSPSDDNSDKKIWHLLVNTQGTNTNVITAHLNRGDVPNRTVTNGNVTLKEWFNTCVPRPYRMVYEWRPVRAMFSGDKLDGAETTVRWSDINTAANDTTAGNAGGGAINRPGDPVLTADNEILKTQSAYDIDFSKVTMWKTEFSWYGAVGAVFLCYVPVAAGEARWVRVHHIRASNQHAVASLGNATLPITYLTHGGINSGLSNSGGNQLVKYGASYYIDGGDKGTVRLLSKASDFSRNVSPGFITFPSGSLANGGWARDTSNTSIATFSPTYNGAQAGRKGKIGFSTAVGLMGAYVEGDVTNKVKWVGVDGSNVKLVFTSALPDQANALKLIIPRAQKSLLTFRAKDFILNRKGDEVRNRLQIYPIKLGAGVAGGPTNGGDLLTLRTIKNPLKIVSNRNFSSNGTTLYGFSGTPSAVRDPQTTSNLYVNTKTSTLPVEVGFPSPTPSSILADGAYRYGYFMGTRQVSLATGFDPTDDNDYTTGTMFPVLGKLYRKDEGGNEKYYFSKLFSYPEPIYIVGYFLPERSLSLDDYDSGASGYDFFSEESVTANNHSDSTDQSKWDKLENDSIVTWEEITRLSGARVGQDMKLTPVPDTGNEILAYYGGTGGYQFDLQDYFAYNKEYLSFPLTDEVDILNIYGHYDINQDAAPLPFYVNTALTWEEQ